jgi:hypothetical protein
MGYAPPGGVTSQIRSDSGMNSRNAHYFNQIHPNQAGSHLGADPQWARSDQNAGRHQIGIGGRLTLEFAAAAASQRIPADAGCRAAGSTELFVPPKSAVKCMQIGSNNLAVTV